MANAVAVCVCVSNARVRFSVCWFAHREIDLILSRFLFYRENWLENNCQRHLIFCLFVFDHFSFGINNLFVSLWTLRRLFISPAIRRLVALLCAALCSVGFFSALCVIVCVFFFALSNIYLSVWQNHMSMAAWSFNLCARKCVTNYAVARFNAFVQRFQCGLWICISYRHNNNNARELEIEIDRAREKERAKKKSKTWSNSMIIKWMQWIETQHSKWHTVKSCSSSIYHRNLSKTHNRKNKKQIL